MFQVGCFEVREVSDGKWRVKNTLTGSEHATYGTRDDVVEQLTRQSDLWKQKLDDQANKKRRPGSAFRDRMSGEAKAAVAAKRVSGRR